MAHYLTVEDFASGYLYGDVAARSDTDHRQASLDAAEAEVDGYLRRAGYTLPVAAPTADLKTAVGHIAAWYLRVKLGLAPEPAASSAHYIAYNSAVKWLKDVASGVVILDLDSEAGVAPVPTFDSRPLRGW